LWGGEVDALPVAALAKSCARACEQLAAEALDSNDVARLAERSDGFGDARRWHALAAVERRYRELLATRGLVDAAQAARELVRRGWLRDDLDVFAFALVDLPRSQREVFGALGARLTSFVFAAPDQSDGFDELGALIPERWPSATSRSTPLAGASSRIRAIKRARPSTISRHSRRHPSGADLDRSSRRRRAAVPRARSARGRLRAALGGGTPLAQTRAARLITAVLAFLGERRYEDFAALRAPSRLRCGDRGEL